MCSSVVEQRLLAPLHEAACSERSALCQAGLVLVMGPTPSCEATHRGGAPADSWLWLTVWTSSLPRHPRTVACCRACFGCPGAAIYAVAVAAGRWSWCLSLKDEAVGVCSGTNKRWA